MRTVRDFKEFVLRESGIFHYEWLFATFSAAHKAFWQKLNRLGDTAELSDEEWARLEDEFCSFIRNIHKGELFP